jgi:hypothetical protein
MAGGMGHRAGRPAAEKYHVRRVLVDSYVLAPHVSGCGCMDLVFAGARSVNPGVRSSCARVTAAAVGPGQEVEAAGRAGRRRPL